jgi:hypothetical protein
MSYQAFVSPSNSRLNRSPTGSSLPLCSPSYGDHRAQQALYMGYPKNYNQVSFSPTDESGRQVNMSNFDQLITYQHPPQSVNIPTPRVMYPLTSYSQGNPGFYYDLMQNANHAGSQTAISYQPTLDHVPPYTHIPSTQTHINAPIPTSTGSHTPYIPSNPTIHFGSASPFALVPDTQGSLPPHGGLSSTPTQDHPSSFYDTQFDNTVDIEIQTIGNPMEVGSHQGQPFSSGSDTPPTSNLHHAFHVGCQTTLDPPSLEVKEQKKLSLPTFDPHKMSWQNFSMKLHAALIDRDMEYLLTEPSTNAFNYAHSKELMLELYKKLQGSALDIFSSLNAQNTTILGGGGAEVLK